MRDFDGMKQWFRFDFKVPVYAHLMSGIDHRMKNITLFHL